MVVFFVLLKVFIFDENELQISILHPTPLLKENILSFLQVTPKTVS